MKKAYILTCLLLNFICPVIHAANRARSQTMAAAPAAGRARSATAAPQNKTTNFFGQPVPAEMTEKSSPTSDFDVESKESSEESSPEPRARKRVTFASKAEYSPSSEEIEEPISASEPTVVSAGGLAVPYSKQQTKNILTLITNILDSALMNAAGFNHEITKVKPDKDKAELWLLALGASLQSLSFLFNEKPSLLKDSETQWNLLLLASHLSSAGQTESSIVSELAKIKPEELKKNALPLDKKLKNINKLNKLRDGSLTLLRQLLEGKTSFAAHRKNRIKSQAPIRREAVDKIIVECDHLGRLFAKEMKEDQPDAQSVKIILLSTKSVTNALEFLFRQNNPKSYFLWPFLDELNTKALHNDLKDLTVRLAVLAKEGGEEEFDLNSKSPKEQLNQQKATFDFDKIIKKMDAMTKLDASKETKNLIKNLRIEILQGIQRIMNNLMMAKRTAKMLKNVRDQDGYMFYNESAAAVKDSK